MSRDLTANRKRARTILKDKLDLLINGKESKIGKKIARLQRRKYNRDR
jgi:hypothetical protein